MAKLNTLYMSSAKTIELSSIRSSKYDDNIERLGDDSNTCFCCGKHTAKKLFVHYTTDDQLVNERDENKVINSQGFFPIGSECAKKLPKDFIFESR